MITIDKDMLCAAIACNTDATEKEARQIVDTVLYRQCSGSVLAVVAADDLQAVTAALRAGQEPLGEEFEAVWDANRETLYEP